MNAGMNERTQFCVKSLKVVNIHCCPLLKLALVNAFAGFGGVDHAVMISGAADVGINVLKNKFKFTLKRYSADVMWKVCRSAVSVPSTGK